MRIIPKALYDRRVRDRMRKQDDVRSAEQKKEKRLRDNEDKKLANLLAKPLLQKLALQLKQAIEKPTIIWEYDEKLRDVNLLVAKKIQKTFQLRYYSVSFIEGCLNEPQGSQEKNALLRYMTILKVS